MGFKKYKKAIFDKKKQRKLFLIYVNKIALAVLTIGSLIAICCVALWYIGIFILSALCWILLESIFRTEFDEIISDDFQENEPEEIRKYRFEVCEKEIEKSEVIYSSILCIALALLFLMMIAIIVRLSIDVINAEKDVEKIINYWGYSEGVRKKREDLNLVSFTFIGVINIGIMSFIGINWRLFSKSNKYLYPTKTIYKEVKKSEEFKVSTILKIYSIVDALVGFFLLFFLEEDIIGYLILTYIVVMGIYTIYIVLYKKLRESKLIKKQYEIVKKESVFEENYKISRLFKKFHIKGAIVISIGVILTVVVSIILTILFPDTIYSSYAYIIVFVSLFIYYVMVLRLQKQTLPIKVRINQINSGEEETIVQQEDKKNEKNNEEKNRYENFKNI